MTIQTYEMDDGAYVVSENDVWVEGRFDSIEAAHLAVSVDPESLSDLWKQTFAEGKEVLTLTNIRSIT